MYEDKSQFEYCEKCGTKLVDNISGSAVYAKCPKRLKLFGLLYEPDHTLVYRRIHTPKINYDGVTGKKLT